MRIYQLGKLAGVSQKPKLHLLMHMVARCEEQGSPNGYTTFEDEGLSAVLKSIGQVAHRAVWHYRIFQFFENMSQTHAATKRRRSG